MQALLKKVRRMFVEEACVNASFPDHGYFQVKKPRPIRSKPRPGIEIALQHPYRGNISRCLGEERLSLKKTIVEENMKLNKKLITTAAVLFLAVFTTLGAQTIEEWSGFGTITVSAAANLGFAPFNTWVIEISSDESDNVDGTWSDRAGHTGSIYGTVEYWLDGDGSGTWDCDQHNDTGTWYGNFGRDGVGDTCYCQWYYWGGFGGGFQGTRTQ